MWDQVSGKINTPFDWFASLSSEEEEEGDEEEAVAETKQAPEEEEEREEEQLNRTLAEMKAQEVAELKR